MTFTAGNLFPFIHVLGDLSSSSSPLFILGLHILANGKFSTWPRPYTKVKKGIYTIKRIKTVKIIKKWSIFYCVKYFFIYLLLKTGIL